MILDPTHIVELAKSHMSRHLQQVLVDVTGSAAYDSGNKFPDDTRILEESDLANQKEESSAAVHPPLPSLPEHITTASPSIITAFSLNFRGGTKSDADQITLIPGVLLGEVVYQVPTGIYVHS